MNPTILASATKIIPNNKLLVNMVRLRVRQLAVGHRPLILAPPGMGMADIALSEIAAGKLESAVTSPAVMETPAAILPFPSGKPAKKAA
jgi:DNA-directed RNA polymerase subunit K/omega